MRARPSTAALVAALLVALVAGPTAPAAAVEGPPPSSAVRQVMFVGNNWEGTATVIDARTYETLGTLDTIPDREERMAEIALDPARLAFFLAIRLAIGEGNDQFTDDMFTSHDGRYVFVSRPSFADVVSIDLLTGLVAWRFPLPGYRADHMAISPDGTRLLVSDSLENVVHELDTATGEKTGEFGSGDSPHENVYVDDGQRVLHASIGRVYTPTDANELGIVKDTSKGERYFQVVDAESLEVLERWDIGERLAAAGYEDMSAAVRPMAPAPDGRTVYFQVSFHFGYVVFDRVAGEVLDVVDLPLGAAEGVPREQYVLDSAHHGLALDPTGETLCVAGTMSDYAALVDVESGEHRIVTEGPKPYWSTNGPDGRSCWISFSGDDTVGVVDYATGTEIARIDVGDHPQRVRPGVVRHDILSDPDGVLGPDGDATGVTRLAGPDRYATAAAVAAETFPHGAATVFLATGEVPADALALGPVAGRHAGPVLLTGPDALPSATAEALEVLAPVRVVVAGGTAAVSDGVLEEVAALTGADVERVAGDDRVQTAAAIAERFAPDPVPVVYLAGGSATTDALAAGPAAGAHGGVVLLVEGDAVPAAVDSQLRRLAPERIVVVGGESAVSPGLETALADYGTPVERLAGADRAGTAAAVAGELPDAASAYVASGTATADALVGAPAAVADGAPILLVDRDAVPAATRQALADLSPTAITVLGGDAVVAAGVVEELAALAG